MRWKVCEGHFCSLSCLLLRWMDFTLCRNLLARMKRASSNCRCVGWGGQTARREMISTCCFLHRTMRRDFRVGIWCAGKAVKYQWVHHARHLTEAIRWRGAAGGEEKSVEMNESRGNAFGIIMKMLTTQSSAECLFLSIFDCWPTSSLPRIPSSSSYTQKTKCCRMFTLDTCVKINTNETVTELTQIPVIAIRDFNETFRFAHWTAKIECVKPEKRDLTILALKRARCLARLGIINKHESANRRKNLRVECKHEKLRFESKAWWIVQWIWGFSLLTFPCALVSCS